MQRCEGDEQYARVSGRRPLSIGTLGDAAADLLRLRHLKDTGSWMDSDERSERSDEVGAREVRWRRTHTWRVDALVDVNVQDALRHLGIADGASRHDGQVRKAGGRRAAQGSV